MASSRDRRWSPSTQQFSIATGPRNMLAHCRRRHDTTKTWSRDMRAAASSSCTALICNKKHRVDVGGEWPLVSTRRRREIAVCRLSSSPLESRRVSDSGDDGGGGDGGGEEPSRRPQKAEATTRPQKAESRSLDRSRRLSFVLRVDSRSRSSSRR